MFKETLKAESSMADLLLTLTVSRATAPAALFQLLRGFTGIMGLLFAAHESFVFF